MSGAGHEMSRLDRLGEGRLQQLTEEARDLLESRLQWYMRESRPLERERWLRAATRAWWGAPAIDGEGSNRNLVKRTRRYYDGFAGSDKLKPQSAEAEALWKLCYCFTLLWERKSGRGI